MVETLIGAGLAAAAVAQSVNARRERRLAWAAYVFAMVGTLFGLTVALLRGLQGWIFGSRCDARPGLAGGFVLLSRAASSRGVNE